MALICSTCPQESRADTSDVPALHTCSGKHYHSNLRNPIDCRGVNLSPGTSSIEGLAIVHVCACRCTRQGPCLESWRAYCWWRICCWPVCCPGCFLPPASTQLRTMSPPSNKLRDSQLRLQMIRQSLHLSCAQRKYKVFPLVCNRCAVFEIASCSLAHARTSLNTAGGGITLTAFELTPLCVTYARCVTG